MEAFLGVSKLTTKAGEAAVSTAFAGKKYVMLYFSAAWCGPCKQFTPKLVEFYNKHKDTKNFEVLFVSRDKDEESFKVYYEHHPWPAVYNKAATDALSSSLKIQGIPSLLVVDAENPSNIITKDGRMGVMADPAAASFPWPPGLTSTLFASEALSKTGTVPIEKLTTEKDYIFLYFSASWCGPCKSFTPKLVEFYNKHKDAKNFEIIFLSLDRDEASFKSYYEHHPWLAIYGNNVQAAASILGVQGIPSLFLYDTKQKKVVSKTATSSVSEDPEAKEFPWPSTVSSLVGTKEVTTKTGTASLADATAGKEYVLLYFSASWCPPCKAFTPKLVEFYNKHKESKKFEIIFMSLDRDEASFKGYYEHHPWLAVYGDSVKAAASKIGLEGIPTLAVLTKTGDVITTEGVEAVVQDAEAAQFPWE